MANKNALREACVEVTDSKNGKKPTAAEIMRRAGHGDCFLSEMTRLGLKLASATAAKDSDELKVRVVGIKGNSKDAFFTLPPPENNGAVDSQRMTYRELLRDAHLTIAEHNKEIRTVTKAAKENWAQVVQMRHEPQAKLIRTVKTPPYDKRLRRERISLGD